MNTATLGTPLPNKTLKIDSRGRVRFSSQGFRFEITKNGMNVYERMNIYGRSQETPAYFNVNRLSLATLRLIVEASTLVGL